MSKISTRSSQFIVPVVMLFVFAAFVCHVTMKSPLRLFWTDEVLTEVVVHEKSLSATIDSLHYEINAMPPTYFTILWTWIQGFGSSALSIRLLSSVGTGLAFWFCWSMLRLGWSSWVAFLATWLAFASSASVLNFNAEARCYSLFLAWFCAAGYCFVKASCPKSSHNIKLVLMSFVSNGLLVTTHYVGAFYSAGLIAAAAISYWIFRRRGYLTYLYGAIAGSATILLCIPFYLSQRSLGAENSWIPTPNFSDLLSLFSYGLNEVHLLLLLATAALAGQVVRPSKHDGAVFGSPIAEPEDERLSFRRAVICVILVSVGIPVMIWIESKFGMKLFVPRYFLPSALVWPCLFVIILSNLSKHLAYVQGKPFPPALLGRLPSNYLRISGAAILVLLPLYLLARDSCRIDPEVAIIQERVQQLAKIKLPFVSSDFWRVLPLRHYSGQQYGEWIELPTDGAKAERRAARTAAKSLSVRYWPGFARPLNEMLNQHSSVCMLLIEWNAWVASNFLDPKNFHIDPREDGLVVIRKRSLPIHEIQPVQN
jgi:hypothetical protein